MQRAMKIRLLPTREQEILFWKSAGTARWAYNYFLSANEQVYKEDSRITEGEVRKYINNAYMAERRREQCYETGGEGCEPGTPEILQRHI